MQTRPVAGVQVRTLLLADLPLLVVGLGAGEGDDQLRRAVADRGLEPVDGFVGRQLPRGARIGFVLDAAELRLVDDADVTLLRAPRHGVDPGWRDRSVALRGTMLLVVEVSDELDLAPSVPVRDLVTALDELATNGGARGAIVGVVEERPNLPLLFG